MLNITENNQKEVRMSEEIFRELYESLIRVSTLVDVMAEGEWTLSESSHTLREYVWILQYHVNVAKKICDMI